MEALGSHRRKLLRLSATEGAAERVAGLAAERGVVEKSGTHFALDGERIGNGRERAVEWLRANPQAFDRLVAKLRAPAPEGGLAPAPAATG